MGFTWGNINWQSLAPLKILLVPLKILLVPLKILMNDFTCEDPLESALKYFLYKAIGSSHHHDQKLVEHIEFSEFAFLKTET